MNADPIEAEYAEAAKTGIEPANTPLGAVRKHQGAWRKRDGEWCALVANMHEPRAGEYVVCKRNDGATREKLLLEKLEDGPSFSLWSVTDYDGRYDDNDPEDADPMGPY